MQLQVRYLSCNSRSVICLATPGQISVLQLRVRYWSCNSRSDIGLATPGQISVLQLQVRYLSCNSRSDKTDSVFCQCTGPGGEVEVPPEGQGLGEDTGVDRVGVRYSDLPDTWGVTVNCKVSTSSIPLTVVHCTRGGRDQFFENEAI